jgi:hypothetical protein
VVVRLVVADGCCRICHNNSCWRCMAGPQTLFGYQLATNQTTTVGLAAGVGHDMPASCKVISSQLTGTPCSRLPAMQCILGHCNLYLYLYLGHV